MVMMLNGCTHQKMMTSSDYCGYIYPIYISKPAIDKFNKNDNILIQNHNANYFKLCEK